MAVVKVYCTNCGQRVSGDETFYGTTAHCPVCNSEIQFPKPPARDSDSPPPASPMPSSGIIPPPPGARVPAAGAPVSKPFAGGGVTTPMPRHPNQRAPLLGSPPAGASPMPAPPLPASGAAQGAAASAPPSPAGVPGMPPSPPGSYPASEAAKAPSLAPRDADEPAPDDDPGVMPLLVLGSGIASLVLCSGLLVLSAVAIVGGHLTMMRLDAAGIREGRNKVVAGTLLGYISVFLFLLAAIATKLAWPAIQKALDAG